MGAEETTTTTTRPTTPTSSSSSTTTTDQQQQHNLGVVFQLIDCREWEGVISFFNKVPEAASIGRIYKENVENLALHEVVRQQNPPLTVINLLLELNPKCISHRGHEGNLPLHYACANKRISSNSKILNRLLEAYPTAVRMRNDDDALPIHLACQHQQHQDQEESIKILLQYFPEGYYLKDADDFTPADYITVPSMKQSMERLVPILIQTAKAATQRTTMEYTVRERGIQEAHTEFIRQMKERQDEMEQDLLVCQLELQDQLTVEKERNITLVEQIVQLQHNEQTFIGKMNQLTNTLQQERTIHQEERERTKREYKRILNITTEYDDNDDDNNNDHNNTKNPEEQNDENDDTILSHLKSLMHHRKTHEQLLNEMSHDLTYNSNMVRNLNELLSSKEEQIQDLQQQQTILQRRYEESIERGNRFEQAYEESQKECMVVRDEMQKLAKLYTNQQDQLTEANRIVRVQDSRLASIKSLAQSLNFNIESWALDDQQQQQQQQHEEEADKDEEDEEEWEKQQQQQQQQKSTHQQQQHQQQHSLPPPKESPPQTPSSATTFQVLEGMEAICRHSSRGRGGQQGERASPNNNSNKVMAEDYYSLKTNDTSMSTRPSSDDDDITSLRLTMMTSPPRTKTTTSTTTNNNTNPTTTTTTSNNNSSSTTMTMAMTPSRYREEYG